MAGVSGKIGFKVGFLWPAILDKNRGLKMKTRNANRFAATVAVMVAMLLSGCGATKVSVLTYNKPIPTNQASVLVIPGPFTVTSFNAEPVKWTSTDTSISLSAKAAAIKLPSGNNSFNYSYYHHTPSQTTFHNHGSFRTRTTTPARTVSYDRVIRVNMLPAKRYKIGSEGILEDTDPDDKYDNLPK